MGKITIAIDPGRQTGLAIHDGQKIVKLMTTDFWGAFFTVTAFDRDSVKVVYIEDTSDMPIYERNRTARTWAAVATTGRRIGEVCAEARLLADGLEHYGFKVIRRKKTSQKLNAKMFERLSGWKGRTNQHERDAGALLL